MKYLKYMAVVAAPLLFAAGCETTSQNDKAMMERANEAKAAAEAAAAAARAAADAANRAAAEAKAAGDKADRIFQKNLRK